MSNLLPFTGTVTNGVNELLTIFSGMNTKFELVLGESPTGGHLHLLWHPGEADEETTAAIDYNADTAAIGTALVNLTALTVNDFEVTAGSLPGSIATIEMKGAFAAANMSGFDVPDFGTDATALTGAGDPPTATIVKVQANPDGGTRTFTYGGQTTAALDYNAGPDELQAAFEALSNIGAGNVQGSGGAGAIEEEQTLVFVGHLAGLAIGAVTCDDSNITVPAGCEAAVTSIAVAHEGVQGTYRGMPMGFVLLQTEDGTCWMNQGGTINCPNWTQLQGAE